MSADARLDALDLELAGLHRLQHAETRARLERLGFDVADYRPLPLPAPFETRAHRLARSQDAARRALTHPAPRSSVTGGPLLVRQSGRVLGVA